MTAGDWWRADYAQLPTALAKLEYCENTLARLGDTEPVVTAADLDEDVRELAYSLHDYYRNLRDDSVTGAPGLDGDLRAIFDDLAPAKRQIAGQEIRPAAELIRTLERR